VVGQLPVRYVKDVPQLVILAIVPDSIDLGIKKILELAAEANIRSNRTLSVLSMAELLNINLHL
jgi:hypothetical protein